MQEEKSMFKVRRLKSDHPLRISYCYPQLHLQFISTNMGDIPCALLPHHRCNIETLTNGVETQRHSYPY